MGKLSTLKISVFVVTLFVTQFAFAQPAGTVTFKIGDVSITHKDKTITQAAKNDPLNAGDTIETKDGRLQLALIDGGKVSLQPNTIYRINKYEFSGKEDGTEYGFTELIKGGLRTISGLIGHKNRERYQLKTAVATIGIRGTEFTVNFNDNNLLMTTNHGSVDVCNESGCLNAMTGQSIEVAGAGAKPKPSGKSAKAAAAPPASSKAVFAASDVLTQNGLPVIFVNNVFNGNSGTVLAITDDTGSGVLYKALQANLNLDASGRLTELMYNPNINEKYEVIPLSFTSYNNDGLVAWGQAASGNYNYTSGGTIYDVNDTLSRYDYIAGITPIAGALTSLSGSYNVFGSTAPFLQNGGALVGAANAVTGNFIFDFTKYSFNYNLTIPTTALGTFGLSGSGSLATGAQFAAGGVVTNSTSCVTAGCSGALGGNLIQGSFFGPSGERVGLQYGINVPSAGENVFGSAVLK